MMKAIKLLFSAAGSVCMLSACSGIHAADIYTVSVDPYTPVIDENTYIGECTIQLGDEISVSGQGAWYKDNDILISKGGIYTISGTYDCGCINVSTDDAVKLIFINADISNPNGYAVVSSADNLIIASDGSCTLTGCGGDYENAVYSDGRLLIAGIGDLLIDGGVFSRGGIHFGRNVSTICEIICTDSGDLIRGKLTVE